MAKQKTIVEEISSDDRLNESRKKLIKQYGDIFKSGRDIQDKPQQILKISPAFDNALGGIPEGSWVMLSGPPKFGKSSLALEIAVAGQKLGKQVFYTDAEGRFKKINLRSVRDLDLDKFELIQSTPDRILSAEDHLNIQMDLIRSTPGCISILDSTSALCAEKELTSEITAQSRASGPKLLSSFCRQMGSVVPVNNTIIVMINHLIANTSGYGSPFMEDGGNKIQYQADIKLRGKGKTKWTNKEGRPIGQTIKWEVLASAMGPPGAEIENYLRYGFGIDRIMELIMLALDLGIIVLNGAWITCDLFQTLNSEYPSKIQGQDQMFNFLSEHSDCFNLLNEEVLKITNSI